MNRAALLSVCFVLVAGLLGGLWWMLSSDSHPSDNEPAETAPVVHTPAHTPEPESEVIHPSVEPQRVATEPVVEASPKAGEEIPESYKKALAGVTGRVLEETGEPVKNIPVTLMHVDLGELMVGDLSTIFEHEQPELVLEVGTATTGEDGRFLIPGAECRSFLGVGVDLGGARATLRVVDQAVHNGETTDVGDVVLKPFVTFLGKVVDESGRPVADARVRATDLPAIVFQSGVQNIKSDSRFIIDENPRIVFEAPKWLLQYQEKLPIPSTHSGPDGSFRLAGVPQGLVTVVVDHPSFVASTRPMPSGKRPEKEIGEILVASGRTLSGIVVDAAGRKVVGIEVLAGVEVPLGHVAITGAPTLTDEQGRFTVAALPNEGECTFAVRRDKGHPWQTLGPQPQSADVRIELPGAFTLTVHVKDEAGAAIPEADLLLRPHSDMDEVPFFGHRVNVHKNLKALDGVATESLIESGNYVLVGRAPGRGLTSTTFVVDQGDASVDLVFGPSREVTVQVLDDKTSAPVEHALVTVEQQSTQNFIPFGVGLASKRTNKEGVAALGPIAAQNAAGVLACVNHPSYARLSVPLGAEAIQVVRMVPGGTLKGHVVYNGRSTNSLYMIVITGSYEDRRSFIDFAPRFSLTDLEGNFRVSQLRAGKYEFQVLKRFLDVDVTQLLVNTVTRSFEPENVFDGEFEIEANKVTDLVVDIGPAGLGAVATVRGHVVINGVPAEGIHVNTNGSSRRQSKSTQTDAQGNYEVANIPAGQINLNFYRLDNSNYQEVHSEQVELRPDEIKILDVNVRNIYALAHVVDTEGANVSGASLSWQAIGDGKDGNNQWSSTDSDGVSRATLTQPGSYRVMAQHDELGIGSITVEVPEEGLTRAAEVRLDRGVPCAGRVIASGLNLQAGGSSYVGLVIASEDDPQNSRWRQLDGSDVNNLHFNIVGLTAGSYNARLYSSAGWAEPVKFTLPRGGDEHLEFRFELRANKATPEVVEDGQ